MVWIEDLERFSAATNAGHSSFDALRMAPVWSLLFGISQRQSLTVITATTELQARFDIEKIARYIEELPVIQASTSVPVIRAVRRQCLEHFAAPSRHQSDWDSFDATLDDELRDATQSQAFSLPQAVIALAHTPRTLKLGLRRVWDAWQRLAGEIDFDDLLLMCLLREAEPSVFALVRDYWSEVAGAGYSEDVRSQAKLMFHQRLGPLMGPRASRHESVKKVLAAIFEEGDANETVQGLRHKRYWKRFLNESEVSEHDSDQAVLRVLAAPNDDAILDLLEGPRWELVRRFAHRISAERLLGLLLGLVRRRVSESPTMWDARHDPPGLIPLWAMMSLSRSGNSPKADAIATCVEEAFALGIENLSLVHAIEHYLCGSGRHGQLNMSELDGRLAERVRQTLWRQIVKHYAGDPDRLVHGLDGALPAVLPFLVWGSRRQAANQTNEEPFAGWSRLADTILNATSREPAKMLRHVASLVTDGSPTYGGTYKYTFNIERARRLFQNEARVLRLFRDSRYVPPEADSMVRAVQEAALQYFTGSEKASS